MPATARCPRSVASSTYSFGLGRWVGSEVGVDWDRLRTRKCWIKRAHRERRVPVWFDDVPDDMAGAACTDLPDARWSAIKMSQAAWPACAAATQQGLGLRRGAGFSGLLMAARSQALRGGRPLSLLLVGDSVDRKMWEAFNNSRAAAALHEAGVCLAWTPQMHSPELALSWLSDPELVSQVGAPLAAHELRQAWDRREFVSFAKLDKAHDELANHAAVLQAAGRGGVPKSWSAAMRNNWPRNSSAAAPTSSAARWKILHGRPDVCGRAGAPSAI
eukprot:1239270-Prymnesium_polylepis.1